MYFSGLLPGLGIEGNGFVYSRDNSILDTINYYENNLWQLPHPYAVRQSGRAGTLLLLQLE